MDITPAGTVREQAAEILSALKQGKSWSGEFLVKRRDGVEFPVMVTDSPIFNEEGNLIGIVGVSVDNTNRRRTEEERDKLLAREQQAVLKQKTRIASRMNSGDPVSSAQPAECSYRLRRNPAPQRRQPIT